MSLPIRVLRSAFDSPALGGSGDGCSRRCRQSASAELTAVPRLVESSDAHGIGLEQLLDDVTFGVVEVVEEIGLDQGRQVAHAVNEELRV